MKRRLLSLVCALALLMGMLTVPTFAAAEATTGAAVCGEKNYSSLQAAVDDYTFGIIVLQEDAQKVDVPLNVYLDLNGHNVAEVAVSDGATLYVSDGQTDDYTVADGVYGKITAVAGNVQAAEGYLAIEEEDAVSFHRVDLAIKSMSLRPGNTGVYYTSNFAADETVAAKVESYGVALSVAAEPNAENLETLCGYSVLYDFGAGEKSGTLLTGIMDVQNDAETNAAYGAMDIYGRAYIKTAEGYAFGTVAVRNLQQQVEAIDAILGDLNDTQKAGITAFYNTYKEAMADWNIPNLRGNQLGDTVITIPVQTEDGVVTETVTVEQDGMSITIPFGVLVEAAQLTLNVTKKEQSDSGIEATADQTLMPFDIHVEGVSPENTVPLTVALGKVMPENLNMGNYSIYHVEADGTKEMQLVAGDEAFTAHNQYKYTLDGELTLHMATFSEVAVRTSNANVWAGEVADGFAGGSGSAEDPYLIRNADQLAYLNELISADNEDYNAKNYKLLADIDFGGVDNAEKNGNVWYPIGYWNQAKNEDGGLLTNSAGENYYTYGGAFQGTFDGNGNTIANIYQNTWIMTGNYDGPHWDEAMGLFGYVYGGAVKNLTIENFQNDGEFTPTGCVTAYAVNSTFENIALLDCNPRVYNTGNGGIVGIGGNSNDPDTYKLTFNNITIDNSNKITALWGSWDVACGGLVGMFRGAGHVYMNNCHVAAQIDVYNDVCGNYQYYWYRYSGMLVGTNKNMVTDENGYTLPETSKYHAENCTVHFGDWNNYYYCELVANSLASYTHDHQFSRLTEITALSDIADVDAEGNVTAWKSAGNYVLFADSKRNVETAQCFHIVKDGETLKQHLHTDAGTEEVNGETVLKENNQIIYLPFNQLFTGYGWGVKHIPVYNGEDYAFEGVTILDRFPSSDVKFEDILNKTLAQNKENLVVAENTVLTVGQIFAGTAADIMGDKVQVFVSPADDNSTVEPVSYASTNADWTTGTLQFKGRGKATITITDYYFCEPTVITVTVDSVKAAADAMEYSAYIKEKEETVNGVTKTVKYVEALCPACAFLAGNKATPATVAAAEWRALEAKTAKYNDGAHKHFYLAAGTNYTKQTGLIQFVSNTKGCISLNGQNITSSARVFYAEGSNTVLNIMGSGKVTGGTATYVGGNYSGSAVDITTGGNLFGGTYTSTKAYPVVSARGAGSNNVVNIWEGVVIEKSATATKGRTLYIGDHGTVNMYGGVIRGGTAVNPDATNLTGMNGYGGNIIIKCNSTSSAKASFNLYGGEVTGGTAAEKGGNIAVYKNGGTKSSAVVNIAGGSVTGGSIYLDSSNQTLKLTGAPTVSEIELATDVLADVNGLSLDVQPIRVVGEDQVKFTKAISENAEAYEKVFYVDQDRKAIAAVDSQLMIDDLCPHCDVALCKLTWTSLTKQTALSTTKRHYRVTQNIDHTANSYILRATATEVIVDTNGFDLTSAQRCFYINKDCEIYIFDSKGTTDLSSTWTGGEGCILYAEGTGAAANIYDVSMTASTKGSACAISGAAGSALNIYSGTVNPITLAKTGATWANVRSKGTVNIYGGTFHPVTLGNGLQYALYAFGGNMTIHDGTFYGRVAAGVNGTARGTLTINDGTFEDVVAGVDASTPGTVNINGGTVTGTVSVATDGTLNISGNSVISQVDLLADQKLNIGKMTDGASVTINAVNGTVVSSAITAENADTYGKYFHATDDSLDVTVVTQGSGDKVLQVTDDFCVHCGVSNGDIQWIGLDDTTVDELKVRCASKSTYYYLPTGHYKLTGDVSFAQQMMIGDYESADKITSDLFLDLNGYTITLDEGAKSRVFYVVNAGSKLTIVDSRPDVTHGDETGILGGRIIGTSTVGGGSLFVGAGTRVDMYGGTVLESALAEPSQGGAVYCAGIFNLYGGKIIGTTVSQWGGVFYLPGGYLNVYGGTIEGGTAPGGRGSCIYTSGNAQLNIYDGTVSGGIDHASDSGVQITLSGAPIVTQLCIPSGKTITVNELTEGASVGVTAKASGVFTNAGAAQYADYFHVYDDKAYTLVVEGDALALTENAVLYAGFNRKSLVPDYEVRLGGGNGVRMATECIDSVTASCVALQRGGETYLICTMDFLTAGDGYVVPVQRAVSSATGIPESNIMLHTTHTHSAPYVNGTGWTNDYGQTYRNDICRWIAESAVAAVEDLAEATASYGSTTAKEHAFVRHYEQKFLGIGEPSYFGANFGDSTAAGYITTGHAGEVDNEMQLIRFARADKKDVLLANFPAHATFNENLRQMSADFPHYFRTYVENNNSDILCAYFIAAAGNQVPTSRLDRETDHTDITDYGNTLGQIALNALSNMTAAQEGDILLSTRTFTGSSNIPTENEYQKALEVKAIWDANGGDRTTAEAKAAGFESIYQVSSIINRHGLSATRTMEIKTMAIGNMSFVFAPYEMFGSDGRAIKDGNATNHDMTFIITCGEGDEGYLPTDLGWDIGSYESHVTMFAKGTNTQLVNEYLAMLEELKAQQTQ